MLTRESASRREVAANLILRLMRGNYDIDQIHEMINSIILMDIFVFFGEAGVALLRKEQITLDWYRRHFNQEGMRDIPSAPNADFTDNYLPMTLSERSADLDESIESLIHDEIKVDVSLKSRGTTLHLNLEESLVVINALVVRRAAIRGGAWSSAGKSVEGPLMETLCRLFSVDRQYFTRSLADDGSLREVDYYLLPSDTAPAKCEVKLMGGGNPESADAVIARDSKVFVASTMSDTNKTQMDELGVLWTELQTPNGFLRFGDTLRQLSIPYTDLPVKADYTAEIENAIQATFAV
ncbi:MAG: CfrBI family restriction endonuclease [Chloroflexi bacterium]|nr:CfrBI family restriction endonuclease [Chloroflexota bacterium]